jgi:hypothetical protein
VGKPDLDVAPSQCAGSRVAPHLAKFQTSVVAHQPFSPHLGAADFFMFPKLNTILNGRRFQSIVEIQENAISELRTIKDSVFQEAFQKWKKRLGIVYRQ